MKAKRVLLTALIPLACSGVAQADWPNFRGPKHDGISQETGFRKAWNEPIPLKWERHIGSGFSSFAAVGDRLFTAGTKDENQTLYCLDASGGDIIWETTIGAAYRERAGGDGPRATPTVSDGKVYMLGALGTVLCLDAQTGKQVWSTKFAHPPQWGYSGSVLVEGNLAITGGGEEDGSIVAFDKTSGKIVWQTGSDQAGYATPYPFTFDGTRYIASFTGESAMIVDAKTGSLALRMPWRTDWKVNAASPIFHDGHLFLSSGYSTGCGLYKLRADAGKLAADEIWRSKVLLNKFQSCILHEGTLYTSDQKALVAVDFMTGKEHWRQRRAKHGTIVLADGHLLVFSQDGELQIAPVTREEFSPLTKAKILGGRCWTVPVLHKGLLYVRNLERVACFDLRG